MDVLLEGLLVKKEKIKMVLTDVKSKYYISVIALVGVAFLLGRAVVLEAVFPCGIALISALVARGRENIYLLPFIVMGIMTNYGTNYPVFGDITAAVAVGILFFLLNKKRLPVVYVGLIAMGITVVIKAFFLLTVPFFIAKDVFMVGLEGILVFCFVYLFTLFFCVNDKKKKDKSTASQGVTAVSVVSVLIAAGMSVGSLWDVYPVYLTALFITVFMGFKMGILEGALAGVTTGFTAAILLMESPAVVGVLACAGVVVGFFMGLSRLVAGTVFAAVCVGFGLISSMPEFYMPAINPVIASVVFISIPKSLMDKIELLFSKLRQDETYSDLVTRENFKTIISDYANCFDRLCNLKKYEGETETMMQMQFKALAKLAKKMIHDLDNPMAFLTSRPFKYSISVGVSAYAKENNICGDSYLCTEFRKGQYMLALSDGMGKGRRASEESSMTIKGLFNLMKAGFDVNLALKTMNNLLLSQSNEEIFSTVDMGLFDRTTGKIQLYKIGAAATFIKRGNTVEAIKMANLPMGLVNPISVDYIEVKAKKGDKIIFVSDGITDADFENGGIEWLRETVESIKSGDPQTISDLIINKAMERYGIREKDDMTVITALVI